MFPPDAHLETHFMFDIYIYPKSFYCIVRNMVSCSAAYLVYKLLYKSDYFTSSWYLIRWVCNSISASIHLPGWPFRLNYRLRLSITLYFWFCNYSPRSDISALQYWVEYVTLRLIWVKVFIFSIRIFCRFCYSYTTFFHGRSLDQLIICIVVAGVCWCVQDSCKIGLW